MTDTRKKLRGITLAVLMVVSVFAGSVALAGTAAAANDTSHATFDTAGEVGNQADNARKGTVSEFSAAAQAAKGESVQDFQVDFTPTSNFDGSFDDVQDSDVEIRIYPNSDAYLNSNNTIGNDSDARQVIDADATVGEVSNGGSTITVGAQSAFQISQDEVVEVYFGDNFLNPSTAKTYEDATLNATSGAIGGTGDLVVQGSTSTDGGGTDEAPKDAWEDQTFKFQGQELEFTPSNSGDYRLYECDYDSVAQSCNTDPVRDLDDENVSQNITTDGLEGDYVIAVDGGNTVILTDENGVENNRTSDTYNFDPSTKIVVQDLNVSFDSDSVPQDSTGTVSFQSDQRQNYNVTVTSDDFDQSTLQDIANTNETFDDGVVVQINDTDADKTFSFDGIDTGSYDFDFDVIDTTADDSASVDVTAEEETTATFGQSVYADQRGDKVEFSLDLQETETARVQVGSDDVNYRSIVTVEDTDGDGVVNFTMNTLNAGRSGGDEADSPGVVYEASESGSDVIGADRKTPSSNLDDPLEAAEYELTSFVGTTEKDAALLSLEQRGTQGSAVLTAPSNTDVQDQGTYDDANELRDAATATDTVAAGNHIVFQVNATGVSGYADAPDGDSADNVFQDQDADNFTGGPGETAVGVTLRETSEGVNQEPESYTISDAEAYTDDDNETLYVVFDPDNYDIETGTDYRLNFTVPENNAYVGGEDDVERTSQTFTLADRSATFETNDDGIVQVEADGGQTISGTTNVAPGTELSVRAKASTFLKTQSTTVQDDGSFSAEFDFSNVEENTSFTATLPNRGFSDDAETPGQVGQAQVGAATFNNQSFTGTADSVNVASVTVSEGGFVTIHDSTLNDGDTFDSVRGTSDYLEPGTTEAVSVALDSPIGVDESGDTFFAMPHLDTNDNEVYDFVTSEGAEDGPYTDNEGNIVLDSATITVEEAATVTFDDQSSSGEAVLVTSASLPDGGFVTIHDDTVADDPVGSVRGTSDYLEAGTSDNVNVTLDDPIEETGQFFAMPHRDTNGNEVYDFVTSEGTEDAPYFNGDDQIVLDGAQVSVEGPAEASVTFNDQTLEDDGSVVVASVSLSEGGFVTIHDDTVGEDAIGSVVATSDYQDSGTTQELEIDAGIEESGTYFAMPHLDTNGNENYDFVSSEGAEDGPYLTAEGDIVLDDAELTVDTGGETPTPTTEPGDEPTTEQTETDGQPGFGLVVSLIALIGAALIALRRRD